LNKSVDGKTIIKVRTYTGEKLMTKSKFGLIAIVLFLTFTGGLQKATAQK